MLLRPARIRICNFAGAARQRGVVLLIALIVLVALTLAGVALIRSVDTTNLIAGNMSFHESAVQASERSTEAAIQWMAANPATLIATAGGPAWYLPARQDPAAGASWESFWGSDLNTIAVTGTADAAGNTVAYVIHRLCDAAGPPISANCAKPPVGGNEGGSMGVGPAQITNDKIYYRVTTRVTGPRNTVALIQTIVAL